jgi:hypothetical protein
LHLDHLHDRAAFKSSRAGGRSEFYDRVGIGWRPVLGERGA